MKKENTLAEKVNLEWYEYDEADEQIAVLQSKIDLAVDDLKQYELSEFSRNAILNEIRRHTMFIDDIKEAQGEPVDTDLVNVIQDQADGY